MYISDKCEWTPYGYDFSLDEKLDSCLDDEDKIVGFLEQNKNYGLDMVFNYIQSHREFKAKYLKSYIIEQGYGLDILINDKEYEVRVAVAKHSYGLDKLVKDKDNDVRAAVARQGYGLDILIKDNRASVREVVAQQGYGLDVLINDEDYRVRRAVAKRGYGLDILINDREDWVREAVADQGYGLDKLINDKNGSVREAADKYLRDHNYRSVFDWAKDNDVDIDIDEWLHSGDYYQRMQLARQGYGLDKLVNDENADVRVEVARQGYGLDKLINDEDWHVRAAVAKQCYGLDILVKDRHENVRVDVAVQGYGLDKLVSDEDWWVRKIVYDYLHDHNYRSVFDWAKDNDVDIDIDEWLHSGNYYQRLELAEHGYGLDKLVNDKERDVRQAVAEHGYGLDILVNDEDKYVRAEVARHGYGLDKLVSDEDQFVRKQVYDYLRNNNYRSVFDWAKDSGVDIDIDEWLHSDDWCQRAQVAKAGYRLDVLINDENSDVRRAVAYRGYGLDKLINDDKWFVREAVARQGYGLDMLINDDNRDVRITVASRGYGLDKLINDKDWHVRIVVAKQGYGLDKLANDVDKDVRRAVRDYIKSNGYKSRNDWAKANPDKVYSNIDTFNTIRDFIYKVDGSNTLKVESSYESIDAFFDDESDDSNRFITILTVDTKVPLIKVEKAVKNKTQVYKFIVDITNNDGNDFKVKSIISSKSKFNQLLESVINALSELPQFSKYADDLENCL